MKIVSAISALCAIAINVPAVFGQERPREREISVTGSGSISTTPDEVTFKVGVESDGNSIDSVRRDNNLKMNAIIKALKESDVPESDVVTTDTSLRKRFTPAQESQTKKDATTFTFTREVLVRLRKIAGAEEILANVMKAGANRVADFSFIDSKKKVHRDAALALAVKDAMQSADTLAAQFGVKRGKVISISPYNSSPNGEPDRVVITGSLVPMTVDGVPAREVATAAFSVGEVKVDASVSVRFDLE